MASNLELKIKLLVDGLSDLLKLKTEVTGLGSSAEEMAVSAANAATAMTDLGAATTQAANATKSTAATTASVGASMETMAKATADAATALADLNTSANSMGTGLGAGAKAALDSAKGLQDTANAAQDAATKVKLAAVTVEGITTGLEQAATEAEAFATSLGGIDQAANDAAAAARAVATASATNAKALADAAIAAQDSVTGYQELATAAAKTASELVALSKSAPDMRDSANAAKDTAVEMRALATEAKTTADSMDYAAKQAEALAISLGGDDQAANDSAAAFRKLATDSQASATVLAAAATASEATALSLDEAATAAEKAASGFVELSAAETAVSLRESATAAEEAAVALQDAASAAEVLAAQDREAATEAQSIATALQDEATAATEAAIQLHDVAEATGSLADTEAAAKQMELANSLQETATAAQDGATALAEAATAAEDLATSEQTTATSAQDAAASLNTQAISAEDAARAAEAAAIALQDVGTSSNDAARGTEAAAQGLGKVAPAAKESATGLAALVTALKLPVVDESAGMFSKLSGRIDELKKISPEAGAAMGVLEAAIKPLAAAMVAAAGVKISFDFLKDAAVKASETELLGITMKVVGENTGYTSGELAKFEVALKAQGISTSAARQSMTQMMQAGLDLGNAADGSASQIAKLARTAQDLAVVTGENSSETLKRMVTNIQQMDTMGLRFMGVTVSMEAAWAKYQTELGQAGPLTEAQKRQAVLNAVLAEGEKMSGAYELSMKSVAKQVASMSRYTEEFSTSLGNTMLPAYGAVVDAGTALMKNLMKVAEEFDKGKNNGKDYGEGIKAALDPLVPIFTGIVAGAMKLAADLGPSFQAVGEIIGSIVDVVGNVGQALMGAGGGFSILEDLVKALGIALGGLALGFKGIQIVVDMAILGWLQLRTAFIDTEIAMRSMLPGQDEQIAKLKEMRKGADEQSENLVKNINKQADAFSTSARELNDYMTSTEGAAAAGKKLDATPAEKLKNEIIALTREQNTGKDAATGLAVGSQEVTAKMNDLAAKVKEAGDSGAISAKEMANLNQKLGNIDKKTTDDLNEAFKQLKTSAKELGSNVSSGADEVAGALSKMVDNGKATADQFQKVFSEKISMAKNAEELAAFTQSLSEAKDRWPGAAKELNAELAQVGKQFDEVYDKQLKNIKTKADWDTLKESIVTLGKDGALSQGEMNIAIQKGEEAIRKLDPAYIAAAKASKTLETASKDVDAQMKILEGTISKVAGQAAESYTAMANGYGKLSSLVESNTKTQMDAIDRRFTHENTLLDNSIGKEGETNTKKNNLLVNYVAEKNALITKQFADQDALLAKQVSAEDKALSAKMDGYKTDEIRINESLGKQADKQKEYQAALKDLDVKRAGAVAEHEIKVQETKAASLEKQAAAYQANVDKLIAEEGRLLGKIKDCQSQIENAKLSGAEKIRNSEINLLGDVEKYEAQKADVAKTYADARSALAEGNMERYKTLLSSAQGKEAELNREVKDGEKIIVSKEQAQKNYAASVQTGIDLQVAGAQKEKAAAEQALAQVQAQIRATEQMRDAVLEMVAALKKMMGEKIELKITADAKQAEEKAQSLVDLIAKKDTIMPIKVQLEAAQVALKKMEDDMAAGKPFAVNPEVTKAEAALKALRDQPGVDLKVKADAEAALAAIEKTKTAIEAAGGKPIQVTATVDKVMGDIKDISKAFEGLSGAAKVTLAADMTAVRTDLGKLKEDIAKGDKLAIQADVTKAEASIAKMRTDAGGNMTMDLKLALDKAEADLAKLKSEATTPLQLEIKANAAAVQSDLKGIIDTVNGSKPNLAITTDLADVKDKLAKVQADLESPKKMPIAADIDAAKTALEKLKADAEATKNTKLVLECDKALADLDKLKTNAAKIGDEKPVVVVGADTSALKGAAAEAKSIGDTPVKPIAVAADGSQITGVRQQVQDLRDATGKPLRTELEVNADSATRAQGSIIKITDALGNIKYTNMAVNASDLDGANAKLELLHKNGRIESTSKVTVTYDTVDSALKKTQELNAEANKGAKGTVDMNAAPVDAVKGKVDALKQQVEGSPVKGTVEMTTDQMQKAADDWSRIGAKMTGNPAKGVVEVTGTDKVETDVNKVLSNLEAINKARTAAEITSNAKASHADLEYAKKLLSDINGVKSRADFDLNSNAKDKKTEIDDAMKQRDAAKSKHDIETNAAEKNKEINDALAPGKADSKHDVSTNADEAKGKLDGVLQPKQTTSTVDVDAKTDTAKGKIDDVTKKPPPVELDVNANTDTAKGNIESVKDSAQPVEIPVNADASTARGEVASVGEAAQPVDIPVSADASTAVGEVQSVNDAAQPVDIPVTADASTAKGEVSSVGDAAQPVEIPVTAPTDAAKGEIASVGDAAQPVDIPVTADATTAKNEVTSVGDAAQPVDVPITADASTAKGEVASVGDAAQPVEIPVSAPADDAKSEVQSVADAAQPVEIPVSAPADDAISSVESVADAAQPIEIPVSAPTDDAQGEIAAVADSVEPIEIPVNAATDDAKGDIESVGDAAKPVDIPVTADTSSAEGNIQSLGDNPPYVEAIATADVSEADGEIQSLADVPPDVEATVTAPSSDAQGEIDSLADAPPDVEAVVTAPTDTAQGEIDALDDTPPEIDVEITADGSEAMTQLRSQLEEQIDGNLTIACDDSEVLEAKKQARKSSFSTHYIMSAGGFFGGGFGLFADGGPVESAPPGPAGRASHLTEGTIPGAGNHDSVHRTLDSGSFVLKKAAVERHGAGRLLEMITKAKATPRVDQAPAHGRIRAILMPGEIVVGKDTVSRMGINNLHALNRTGERPNRIPSMPLHFADGGPVGGGFDFVAPQINIGDIGFAFEKGGSVPKGSQDGGLMQVDLRGDGSRASVKASGDESKNLLKVLGELKGRSLG